ncbi:MAG: hypothetical protein GX620_03435, partial [Chloroflexi bacterium]|nr:hypothetical protein [Chloroflexota bacterium]
MNRKPVVAILVLVMSVLACTCNLPSTLQPTALPIPESSPTAEGVASEPTATLAGESAVVAPEIPADVRGPGFAAFVDVPVSLPASYSGYSLPVDLATLPNVGDFGLA